MSSSRGSAKLERKARDWKPKMKNRSQKAAVSDSGSSQAAQMAMANIKDIGRRRDRGQDIDDAYLAKVNQAIDPTAAARRQSAAAAAAAEKPRRLDGKTLGIVGGLLACCVVGYSLWSHKALSGTLTLDRKPLAGVEMQFHSPDSGNVVARLQTGAKGQFQASWIPAGTYKITVHTPADSKAAVPAIYTKPETTVLRLNIDGTNEDVWLHMFQQKPPRNLSAKNRRARP